MGSARFRPGRADPYSFTRRRASSTTLREMQASDHHFLDDGASLGNDPSPLGDQHDSQGSAWQAPASRRAAY